MLVLVLVLVHFSVLLLLSVGVIFSRFTFQLLRLKLRLHISLFSPYLPLFLTSLVFWFFIARACLFANTFVGDYRQKQKKHRTHST